MSFASLLPPTAGGKKEKSKKEKKDKKRKRVVDATEDRPAAAAAKGFEDEEAEALERELALRRQARAGADDDDDVAAPTTGLSALLPRPAKRVAMGATLDDMEADRGRDPHEYALKQNLAHLSTAEDSDDRAEKKPKSDKKPPASKAAPTGKTDPKRQPATNEPKDPPRDADSDAEGGFLLGYGSDDDDGVNEPAEEHRSDAADEDSDRIVPALPSAFLPAAKGAPPAATAPGAGAVSGGGDQTEAAIDLPSGGISMNHLAPSTQPPPAAAPKTERIVTRQPAQQVSGPVTIKKTEFTFKTRKPAAQPAVQQPPEPTAEELEEERARQEEEARLQWSQYYRDLDAYNQQLQQQEDEAAGVVSISQSQVLARATGTAAQARNSLGSKPGMSHITNLAAHAASTRAANKS
ncbi:hypothetical protein DIPPA_24341 [Diplonema papillatum]|nr:hypothetical protein DIPPA_24341 [Diplonema papillatum]